jgi:hypothetical protein
MKDGVTINISQGTGAQKSQGGMLTPNKRPDRMAEEEFLDELQSAYSMVDLDALDRLFRIALTQHGGLLAKRVLIDWMCCFGETNLAMALLDWGALVGLGGKVEEGVTKTLFDWSQGREPQIDLTAFIYSLGAGILLVDKSGETVPGKHFPSLQGSRLVQWSQPIPEPLPGKVT